MSTGGGVGAARSSGPNPHDAALCRVAFIPFPKEASSEHRVTAMDRFMKQHLPDMQVKHVDVSLNREGHLTTHGYVELGSKQHVRLVTSTTKSRSLNKGSWR